MAKKPISVILSDKITDFVGSWKGFAFHVFVISSWIAFNTYSTLAFDPFPFIFLNLALSTEAAISACFVLMSQNRSAERDRRIIEESYVSNLEVKLSMAEILDKLDKMESVLKKVSKVNAQEKEK